jgi:hypothetical protein
MLVPKTEKDEEEELRCKESRYIRMVKAIFKVCKRQNIPLYSSRYSRKDFTLWQHIALIALMQRIRKSYRESTYRFLHIELSGRNRDMRRSGQDENAIISNKLREYTNLIEKSIFVPASENAHGG